MTDTLTSRGAEVLHARVYQRSCPGHDFAAAKTAWEADGGIDTIVSSSQTALENLQTLAGKAHQAWLQSKCLLVTSPRLVDYAKTQGFTRVIQAKTNTNEAICQALQ